MDSRRILKILTTRWWLIGIVALVGVTAAYFVTTSQNSRITDTWEATAPVLILKTSAESETDYESRLRLAENRARLAVEVELADNADIYRVQADTERGRLEFIAIDSNAVMAEELSTGLRAVYLTAEPTDGIIEQLSRNLDDLEVQILVLGSDRAALVVETPLDPGVAIELVLIEEQLSALRQRAAALSLAIRFPELGTALDEEGEPQSSTSIQAELAVVRSTIVRLQFEYNRLAAANPTAEGSDDAKKLDLLVIDQQILDLESQYIETALTLEELSGGGTSSVVSNRTETINVTSIPTSPTRAAFLGLTLGVLLAVAAVVAIDRLRRPVFGNEDDLAIPIIATVDPARPAAGPVDPWYATTNSRRRSDVQALRVALDGLTTGDPP
jgi:hypothetical protein